VAERGLPLIQAFSVLRGCVSDLRVAPLNYQLRVRAAEALIALQQRDRGQEILAGVAEYYALAGFPVRAFRALKLAGHYGAELSSLERGYRLLATHYSAADGRDWAEPIIEAPIARVALGVAPPLEATVTALTNELYERSMDHLSGATFPQRLPRFPLFSRLAEPDFISTARQTRLKRASAGQTLLRAQEPSQAVSILAHGVVRVVTPDPSGGTLQLARLRSGDIFGEMSLVTGSPRNASVIADEPSDILELPAELFQADSPSYSALKGAVLEIVRGRLHENAVRLSSVFGHLDSRRSERFLSEFAVRVVPSGTTLIQQGRRVPAVYVILDGRLAASQNIDGVITELADLGEGALIGESLFFGNIISAASCVTTRRCLLLRLDAQRAQTLSETYEDVIKAIHSVRDDRLLSNAWLSADR
jgi:CRP-like cAMP-binding protein